jgi:hypothetical protein
MSIRPVPTAAGPAPTGRQLLFTPGPRLGWVFRDRREIALAYSEPQPNPQLIQARAAARAAGAEQSWARAWRWAGKPSIALAVILVLLAGCQKSVSGSFNPGLTIITVVVLCGPGLGYAGLCWLRRDQARATTPERVYHQALAGWEERAAGHENAELARLAGQPEWGSVLIPGHRTDIFGGTLAGWQALLTVHGASILAERPLLTVDLTGQHAAGMLGAAVRDAGIPSVTYHLPHELGRCGLLTELTPGQLADAIAESLHAGTPDGSRADRAVDVWILQQLTGVLGVGGATPQRLAAAVRAALGHIAPNGLLSPGEQELIAGDLFPAAYRQQVTANLVRLDAVLGELARHTGAGWPQKPGRYTCVAMDTIARSAAGEVLTALVMQWLTVQVSTATTAVPAVIIAGADEISRAHAERLSYACEQRGVPLTLMFRHLRDDAARLIGGGTAAFMRLGNHTEAEQAAAYIGRRHTFVISSYTANRGGNQTSTQGSSDGHGTGDSRGDARNRGRTAGSSAPAPPQAAAAAPPAPAPPGTGPPPHPRPTGPTGARRQPGSESTSTPSSRQPCRTCPNTPSCSPTDPAAPCNCTRSNATPRSPASPTSAPRRCCHQAASREMCPCTATRRRPSRTTPTPPSPPPASTRQAWTCTPAPSQSRPGPASNQSCPGGRRTGHLISPDPKATAPHPPGTFACPAPRR